MKNILALVFLLLAFFSEKRAYAEVILPKAGETSDTVTIMDDLIIDRKTQGDVVLILSNVSIKNEVDGDIIVLAGDITVDAGVHGKIVSILGNVKLMDNAKIEGDIISVGKYEKLAGARVSGREILAANEWGLNIKAEHIILITIASILVKSLIVIVAGIIVVALWNEKYRTMVEMSKHYTGRIIAVGFLGYIGATIITALLFFTLVVPLLYFLLVILSGVVSSLYFGEMITGWLGLGSNLFVKLICGLTAVTVTKISLILFIPSYDFITAGIICAIFAAFVDAIGIGMILCLRSGSLVSHQAN